MLSTPPRTAPTSHPPGPFATGRALVVRVAVVVAALALCKLLAPGIITFAGFGAALFLLARNPDRRLSRLALAGILVPVTVNTIADTTFLEDESDLLGMVLVSVILWSLLYLAVWCSGHLLFRAADRLVASEAAAALARERALAEERLRISRELHDSVAHSLTAIVLQSAGARSAVTRHTATEEDLQSLLTGIEKTASQSMRELHRMLGMLRTSEDNATTGTDAGRDSGKGNATTGRTGVTVATGARAAGGPTTAPNPGRSSATAHSPMYGIEEVGELIESSRSAGMDVSLSTSGREVDVDPSIAHTAYRVVQEGLSNVMRHAGTGARTTVTLDWMPAQLMISVRNTVGTHPPAVAVSGGFGLVGLQERVDILGGSLDSGPSAHGYLLLVRVPTTAPSPARTLAEEEDR